jgi:ribosomal protein S27E
VFHHCPGSANLRTPELSIRKCPECGHEIEIFSSDLKMACGNCGFVIFNDISGCFQWCKHAKKCIGEEEYKKLVEHR